MHNQAQQGIVPKSRGNYNSYEKDETSLLWSPGEDEKLEAPREPSIPFLEGKLLKPSKRDWLGKTWIHWILIQMCFTAERNTERGPLSAVTIS